MNYNFFYKKLVTPGGAERLLINLYRELKLKGHSVKILTFGINWEDDFFDEINKDDVVEIFGNTFTKLLNLRSYLKSNHSLNVVHSGYIDFYLSTILLNEDYSLFKHHPSAMTLNCYDKFSFFNKKALLSILKNNPGKNEILKKKNNLKLSQKLFLNLKAIISYFAIKKSKNVFVLSEYSRIEKKALYNVDAFVAQGALDSSINYFQPDINKEYKNYSRLFLSVSRLESYKRIDIVIKAFSKYLITDNNSLFIICGTGPELEALKLLVKSMGIDRSVLFLGFVNDDTLIKLYNNSDLFISVDWADFRITQFEALACGTPILISNETDILLEKYFKDTKYYYTTNPDINSVLKSMKKVFESSRNQALLFSKLKKFYWHEYADTISNQILKNHKFL
jgi:glycosyltransferase involved in cell wall biosynthesis